MVEECQVDGPAGICGGVDFADDCFVGEGRRLGAVWTDDRRSCIDQRDSKMVRDSFGFAWVGGVRIVVGDGLLGRLFVWVMGVA